MNTPTISTRLSEEKKKNVKYVVVWRKEGSLSRVAHTRSNDACFPARTAVMLAAMLQILDHKLMNHMDGFGLVLHHLFLRNMPQIDDLFFQFLWEQLGIFYLDFSGFGRRGREKSL